VHIKRKTTSIDSTKNGCVLSEDDMNKRFSGTGKMAAIALAVAAVVAMPLSASARGWGGHGGGHGYHGGGYHGSYYGGHGGYYGGGYRHGGYWSGGRWIAGALVTGAVIGLVSDAVRPAPVYYGPQVVYTQPGVVYQDGPPTETRRVIETTRTVEYSDPQTTRYIRDDGYDGN
jgi:hypothetical protein